MSETMTVKLPLTLRVVIEGGCLQEESVVDADGRPVPYALDLDDRDGDDYEASDEVTYAPAGTAMSALVDSQGTACDETGLCSRCDTPERRAEVEAEIDADDPDAPVPGSWTDVSQNDAVACAVCGDLIDPDSPEGGAVDLSADWRENDGKHAQNLGD